VTTAIATVVGARPVRLRAPWLIAGLASVAIAFVLGLTIGPVGIRPEGIFTELASHLPFLGVRSTLSAQQAAIVSELRLPRVVLALLVGAMLSMAGASYQGVFRNPLADPYLLGAAAGAGLAVTIVLVTTSTAPGGGDQIVPIAAFAGALGAVTLSYLVARTAGSSSASLLLAGVAVMSFLTAVQAYFQQQNADTLREVYLWILGRLTVAGWSDVLLILPYFVVTSVVLLAHRRVLDVFAVGEGEAGTLGIPVARTRLVIIGAATLATAAAVSVSGLIGFVGLIAPHAVRLVVGASYRVVLPLTILFGGAFLVLADLAARTVMAPAEIPIGVITAFVGAPFFILILRTSAAARR
jgi:iron complex transport system permease protein